MKLDANGATEMHIGEDLSSPNIKLVVSINRKLYLNEKTADVHFLFETDGISDIERIPANKVILSTGSKVFETMFYGSMAEGDEVKISDVSSSAFREFLQFFYLDEISLSVNNIADVMNLVRKYGIERCMVQCSDFLKDVMTNEDVCSAYELAVQFDLDDLKHFCKRKISANAEAVLKSNDFLNCKGSLFQLIVRMDSLMCEEICVFDACIAWAKRSCEMNGMDPSESKNLRAKLGESVLYSIHFNRMQLEHFASRNAKCVGLFTGLEMSEILQLIACKEYKPDSFTASPVCYATFFWDEKRIFECCLDRLGTVHSRNNRKKEMVTLTTVSENRTK
ncbi:BTB/POZ domain-containing protein 6-B-like [Bradysia coprophila]|uniref:BTB/POZ domain-containing protein 6-B-like n=1 Tax=Bradysia coprophila TaxID=38358 RepID=UPI00187D8731|nr:BTB/POZ domain-containing protein 6-B-like [Bradysia coprophila]